MTDVHFSQPLIIVWQPKFFSKFQVYVLVPDIVMNVLVCLITAGLYHTHALYHFGQLSFLNFGNVFRHGHISSSKVTLSGYLNTYLVEPLKVSINIQMELF